MRIASQAKLSTAAAPIANAEMTTMNQNGPIATTIQLIIAKIPQRITIGMARTAILVEIRIKSGYSPKLRAVHPKKWFATGQRHCRHKHSRWKVRKNSSEFVSPSQKAEKEHKKDGNTIKRRSVGESGGIASCSGLFSFIGSAGLGSASPWNCVLSPAAPLPPQSRNTVKSPTCLSRGSLDNRAHTPHSWGGCQLDKNWKLPEIT